jgi:hypothetical protein
MSSPTSDAVTPPLGVRFAERLSAPWWGYLLVAALTGMLGVAYGYAIGSWAGWLIFVPTTAVAFLGLSRLATPLRVDRAGLRVGRAILEPEYVGTACALAPDEARTLRGRAADPRAFLTVRSWMAGAVRVDVADDRDPTPYWLVSTRRPAALVSALNAVRVDAASPDAAGWSPSRPQPPSAPRSDPPHPPDQEAPA